MLEGATVSVTLVLTAGPLCHRPRAAPKAVWGLRFLLLFKDSQYRLFQSRHP